MRMFAVGVIAVWLVALSVCDLRTGRLPNVLTGPGAVAILAVATWHGRAVPAMLGALALAGGYLLVHLVGPQGMGAGDVKLAVGVGALTGAFGAGVWVLSALGAPLLTVLFAVLARRRTVPHGPSMCLAGALALAVVTAAG